MDNKLQKIQNALRNRKIFFRQHAVEMMISRNITRNDIYDCIRNGDVIEEYESDKPFPSYLICNFRNNENIHIVVAFNEENDILYVITAYIPDLKHFENDFKTRRKK